MTVKSHVLTSTAIFNSVYFLGFLDYGTNAYLFALLGVLIGSVFPDIDEPNSFLGSKVKIVSIPTNFFIGHRTLTHNMLVYIVPMGALWFYDMENTYAKLLINGFLFGAILHILEDSMTNSGVKGAMFPLIRNFSILPYSLRFSTGGIFEKFVFLPLIFILILSQYIFFLKLF